MNVRLCLRSRAETDLAEISRWYENQSAGLGIRFLVAFDQHIEEIRNEPRTFAVIYREVRRLRMREFPYHIYYCMEPDQVVVLGIFHAARDPDTWRERL